MKLNICLKSIMDPKALGGFTLKTPISMTTSTYPVSHAPRFITKA